MNADAYYDLPEAVSVKFFHSKGELYFLLAKVDTGEYIYRFEVLQFPTKKDQLGFRELMISGAH